MKPIISFFLLTFFLFSCRNRSEQKKLLTRADSIYILRDSCKFKNLQDFEIDSKIRSNLDSNYSVFNGFVSMPFAIRNDTAFTNHSMFADGNVYCYSWQQIDSNVVTIAFLSRIGDIGQTKMFLLIYNKAGKYIGEELLALSTFAPPTSYFSSSQILNDTLFQYFRTITYSLNKSPEKVVLDSCVYRKIFNHQTGKFSSPDTIFHKKWEQKIN
jgi:hypothetical protein